MNEEHTYISSVSMRQDEPVVAAAVEAPAAPGVCIMKHD